MISLVPIELADFFELVDLRRNEVRRFIQWAESQESGGSSMYVANRTDIADARLASEMYRDTWWGVVVFTSFGTLNSTRAVCRILPEPVDPETAERWLASVPFSSPKVGHHRIRPGLRGALIALVAACDRSDLFHEILFTESSFDDRFQRLRTARLPQWGRTTCFDLLLRTGVLGIGEQHYEPEIAYLRGSTGPKKGFQIVWDREVNEQTASWCERVLQVWHQHWSDVSIRVGTRWSGRPYAPGDLENALCIYKSKGASERLPEPQNSSCRSSPVE